MGTPEKENKLVEKLMSHSLAKLPFQDFEDRLMDKIYLEEQHKKAVSGNIRIAWIFFCAGLFFGLLITSLISNMDTLIAGFPLKKITFYLQILIALILLFQFEKLIGFSLNKKN